MARAKKHDLSAAVTVLLVGLAAFFAAFLFYPLLYMFRHAFWVDGEFSLVFFQQVFQNPIQRESVVNSLLIGTTVTGYDARRHKNFLSAVKARDTQAIKVNDSLDDLMGMARMIL